MKNILITIAATFVVTVLFLDKTYSKHYAQIEFDLAVAASGLDGKTSIAVLEALDNKALHYSTGITAVLWKNVGMEAIKKTDNK
jgi:hypothetical protein